MTFAGAMRESIAADDQAWPLPSSSCVTSSGETMSEGERMDQLCCGVRFDAVASKFADVGENVARELPERVRHGLQDVHGFISLNILFTIIHNPSIPTLISRYDYTHLYALYAPYTHGIYKVYALPCRVGCI